MTAAEIAHHLHGRRSGAGYVAQCPAHEDRTPSLSLTDSTDGKVLAHCHAGCEQSNVVAALKDRGLWPDNNGNSRRGTIVAEYDYRDERGQLLFQAVRFDPKDFRQRQPDGSGGWIWNIQSVRLVLYRLPELLKRNTEKTFVCEGEKDVAAIESLGLLATCNPMGAGKWRSEYSETLRGRSVVILPDNDTPGRRHAWAVAESLLGTAREVRIIEIPRGKDVSDWKATGGDREELRSMFHSAAVLDAAALTELRARWNLAADTARPRVESEEETATDWPEPEPIQGELPPVHAFSEDLLPESFRPLVLDVTERMQVPMDYAAVSMMLSLAGAVSRRSTIQPKANDSSWVVVPNLWGGIVGPPGLMKSPVLHAATRPLDQIQAEWRREHEVALKDHAREKEEYGLRHNAWKQKYTEAARRGNAGPERPEDELEEPRLRRLIVNDATFEALHETMSDNPAGILVFRDELTGWLAQLDRSGREGERAFCLQAWNGDTGYTIDRIQRGTIHVDACCMSLLGGIQPGRLRSYLVDALRDGPSNDGLIQRFQLLVWPDMPAHWNYVDRKPDAASEEQAARVFRALVELNQENPLRFRFAPDAQEHFIEWLTELESKVRGDELHPALTSHLSKYRSLMPSLALLFELADRATGVFDVFVGSNSGQSQNFLVSLEHARQAAAWCDYLESHARRVYSCVVAPQIHAARELADKIKHRKVGADGSFSCREVYLKGWSSLDSPDAVKLSAGILEDAGWIRPLDNESPDPLGRGRPSSRYQVNPSVWQ